MTVAPFPVDPALTGIAMAYRNPSKSYIADAVLPRMEPFEKEQFKYQIWTQAEGYTIPDTKVGRKSEPNQVEFTGTQVTGQTQDYGLDDLIPATDAANSVGTMNPEMRATIGLTDLIMLDREVRASGIVFAGATYPAGNQATLSGTGQWSDQVNSNPITAILTALDVPLLRPNVAVFGRATFTQLIQHPKIVQAVFGSAQTGGVARRQQIADLFELEDVQVGESFLNTAKKGQTATMSRVWGKHAAFIYRNPIKRGSDDEQITFGFTAQFGPPGLGPTNGMPARVAGSIPAPEYGLRGSTRVRVGEGVKEVISANDLGYLYLNAVA